MHLSTVVLTDADGTLAAETVSPEAVELNIALAHVGVGNKEPGTEDTLGKDIEDGVSDNLAIDTNPAGTICETPNTGELLAVTRSVIDLGKLTWGRRSREGECSHQWQQRKNGASRP